jgi:YD repeat-containing protein
VTHLLASVTDSQYGTTSWSYDSLDRILSESGPNGTLTTTWDDLGRRTSLQVPGQSLISYGFDNNDNIVSITQGTQTTSFTRDALNRAVVRTLPNGVSTEWNIDWNGYLTGMDSKRNSTIFDVHNYTRDRESNITQEVVNGTTNSFGYDDLYRLVSSTVGGVSSSWTYDQVGNRLTQVAGGVTTSYTYNAADRLTAVNGATVTSDLNGNVTAYGSDNYTWDVRGRMVGLARPGLTVSFGYRQDGLRTRRTVNGTATTYLLDGNSIVSETTGGVTTPVLQAPATSTR